MSEDVTRALIEAPDSVEFGRCYGLALDDDQRPQITRELLGMLELRVTGWLPVPVSPETAIVAIAERVAGCYQRAESLLGVNLVVLEHLARASVGLSDFLSALAEEQLCLYAAVLLNALQSESRSMPAAVAEQQGTPAEGMRYEIAEAAFCAGSSDPRGWQEHAGRAFEVDPAGADLAARQALVERLHAQGIQLGMHAEIANGAYRLAAAVADGPFACPMHLLELVIRRALNEPGCVDHVDLAEMVYGATQACGLLDLSAVLLPPGWGWAVHGPLTPTG